jgi:hypothetical protein
MNRAAAVGWVATLGLIAACGPGPTVRATDELPSNLVTPAQTARPRLPDEVEHFDVRFAQNDQWLDITDDAVTLERAPFVIVLLLREPGGVLVNVSANPATFRPAQTGAALEALRGFSETGMAEWLFNKERELFVVDEAPSYWYFTSADDHRFDAPCDQGKILVCRRTVERFSSRGGEPVAIEDAPDELYFVFVQARWEGGQQVEMARSYVAAEFL